MVNSPEEYGRVVGPALLHNNCIYTAKGGHHVIFPMEPIGVLRCAPQGFVTENGYFVNRMDALFLAEYFNQIEYKHNPQSCLNSEDLKKEDLKILKYNRSYNYKEKN